MWWTRLGELQHATTHLAALGNPPPSALPCASSFFRAHPEAFELTTAADKTTVYIRVNNRFAHGQHSGAGGNSTNGGVHAAAGPGLHMS